MIDSLIGPDFNPKSGNNQVPNLGNHIHHALGMESHTEVDELRGLIARNVAALVPVVFGEGAGKGIKALRGASGDALSNGTIGRIVTPEKTSWNVSLLAPVAKALKVQPWQLLLPDLQVSRSGGVVSIEGMKARQWPFPTLRRDELDDLTPLEMDKLESIIRFRIDEMKRERPAEVMPQKRQAN